MGISMVFVFAALAILFPVLDHIASANGKLIADTATAYQAIAIASAAQNYVFANAASVQSSVSSAGRLVLCVPGTPGACPAGEPDLTNGYLPQGFRPANPYQQSWTVVIANDSNGNLQALVESIGGEAIAGADASRIASEVHAIGGAIGGGSGDLSIPGCAANQACGTYAGWGPIGVGGGSKYPNPGPGHVAALLDFNGAGTALNSNYLYRVAVPGHPELNAMQTDLSMTDTGGTAHNISGANVISAQSMQALSGGSVATPSITTANGTVITWDQVPSGGVLSLKGANGTWVHVESVNGAFTLVNSAQSASLFTVDQAGNVVAAGSISATGQIHATGTTSANCPSTGTCGVTSSDVYANSTVGVGPAGGSPAVQMTSAGNLTATDTVQAGSKVVLGTAFGSAFVGSGCAPNGEIAANADGSGQLLACQAGTWVAAGLPVGAVGASCSTPGGLGQDSTGTSLVCQGGVWTLLQARMGSWVMMGSYYVQNGWTVPVPNCLAGSYSRILVSFGGTTTVNNSGTVNQSATYLGNGTWRVNLLDGYGNPLPGYTLAQTYCAFN
jgi:hypothetical protein